MMGNTNNLTVFNEAWRDTLERFEDLKAINVAITGRNMGYRLSCSKLSQIKTGYIDTKASTLEAILLSLRANHPVAFNWYMDHLKELIETRGIESVITVDVTYKGVPKETQMEINFLLHDYLQDHQITVPDLSKVINIETNKLCQIMLGADISFEEYHKIKTFFESNFNKVVA